MNIQEITQLIDRINTSTGEVFSFDSVCEKLIEINQLKNSLANIEGVLRDALENHLDKFPYKTESGSIDTKSTPTYIQTPENVASIKASLPADVFEAAIQVKKALVADKQHKKIVDAFRTVQSSKVSLVVKVEKPSKPEPITIG